jgi:hypothetical protein
MSTLKIGQYRESPMLIVPSAAAFPLVSDGSDKMTAEIDKLDLSSGDDQFSSLRFEKETGKRLDE